MTSFPIREDALTAYPHPSRRSVVLATGGMVATSHPLAAQAGLAVLGDGGNAVDAAIATAAALTVVEPCSNGLGSDAFAIVWDGDRLHGLNGSGRWPSAADADAVRASGVDAMPAFGWTPVTVPGAVDAWQTLHERFGRTSIERVLAPALHHARAGHPIAPVVSQQWSYAHGRYGALGLPEVADWFEVFAPAGRPPRAGEVWAGPGHAACLERLTTAGLRDFYEGEIADAIAAHAAQYGAPLSGDDLAAHRAEWVEPISLAYGDVEVWEIPPNGQGIAALMALGMMQHTDRSWHSRIEAMKLAFADSDAHVADQQHVAVPVDTMLDAGRLRRRAEAVGLEAGPPPKGEPFGGGTVYLCTADSDGMMVSFIQSNYMGFGSGVVVPSFGISLQNRGAGFVLDPTHPNAAAPGKRPRHTIIPGFLTRAGRALGPFGVMGGEMQPQGHLQVVMGMFDEGLNPQAALDAPRWRVERDGLVYLESEVPVEIADDLRHRGHQVRITSNRMGFGRGQIILRGDDGVLVAGTEPRADGAAAGL